MSRLTDDPTLNETLPTLDPRIFAQLPAPDMASILLGLHELYASMLGDRLKLAGEDAADPKAKTQELHDTILILNDILEEKMKKEEFAQVGSVKVDGRSREGKDGFEGQEREVQPDNETGLVVKEEAAGSFDRREVEHGLATGRADDGQLKQERDLEGTELKHEWEEAELKAEKKQGNGKEGNEADEHQDVPLSHDLAHHNVFVTFNGSDQDEDPHLDLRRRSSRRNYFILAFLFVPMVAYSLGLLFDSVPRTSTHPLCRLQQRQHHSPVLLLSEFYPNTSTPLPAMNEPLQDLLHHLRQAGLLRHTDDDCLTPQKQPLQLPRQLTTSLVNLSKRLAEHAQPELPLQHRLAQIALQSAENDEHVATCPVPDTGCPLICYVLPRYACSDCFSRTISSTTTSSGGGISRPSKISMSDRVIAEGKAARAEVQQRAVWAGLLRVLMREEVLASTTVDGAEALLSAIQLAASKVEQEAWVAMREVDEVVRGVTGWARNL